jgi:hypothetical protein
MRPTLLPRVLLAIALLVACLALPLRGSAQAPEPRSLPSLGPEGRVGANVALGLGATTLRGQGVTVLLGEAHLQISPRVRVGLQAAGLTDGVRTSPLDSPDRSEVHLAYGGIRGEVDTGWRELRAGIVLAGATARLKSPLLEREVATRNFLLLEPQIRRTLLQWRGVSGDVQASYRIPLGAPSLPGVQLGDLRGPVVVLSLGARLAP